MNISVDLPNHPYDLVIEQGAINEVGTWVSSLWREQKILIISDDHVAPIYAQSVIESLNHIGFETEIFIFKAGEAQKNLETAEKAWHACAEAQLTRSDGIIALGGGVVGDLAAFVASTYMRGIHFLQIPTSLTAQVDSSIGGKTAINSKIAKNMIGTFTQPDGVLIDPNVLRTLGQREFNEGLGEVIKCAAIADLELWNVLEHAKDSTDLLNNHAEEIIYHSCNVKRKVVVADELDNGVRLYLNFGHTIGHAIEATAGYGKVMHGEAVAIGMIQIAQAAEKKGLMEIGISNAIKQMAEKYGLPTSYAPWIEDELYQSLLHDKKGRGDTIKIVLVPKLGQAEIFQIPFKEMREFLIKDE